MNRVSNSSNSASVPFFFLKNKNSKTRNKLYQNFLPILSQVYLSHIFNFIFIRTPSYRVEWFLIKVREHRNVLLLTYFSIFIVVIGSNRKVDYLLEYIELFISLFTSMILSYLFIFNFLLFFQRFLEMCLLQIS